MAPNIISALNTTVNVVTANIQEEKTNNKMKALIPEQMRSLEKGLGRTALEMHIIDTGKAVSIKQRHYIVSPAI